jgi:hypothetical protein
MTLGPVQLLVVAFEGGDFTGAIRDELERLRDAETINVLDVVFVAKDADGSMQTLEAGLGGDDQLLLRLLDGTDEDSAAMTAESEAQLVDAAASIPPGSAAARALIEHRWALPLREAVRAAGGQTVAETWIAEDDLSAVGLA